MKFENRIYCWNCEKLLWVNELPHTSPARCNGCGKYDYHRPFITRKVVILDSGCEVDIYYTHEFEFIRRLITLDEVYQNDDEVGSTQEKD